MEKEMSRIHGLNMDDMRNRLMENPDIVLQLGYCRRLTWDSGIQ